MDTLEKHWNNLYLENNSAELSWTQNKPVNSLQLIEHINLAKNACIIDVGGGDSLLVDYLLDMGYQNITVLDISAIAIEKAKKRLKEKAKLVNWVVSDILNYKPDRKFDLWHDRATFHFLTHPQKIELYKLIVKVSVTGYLIIGTFSDYGPKKCSGLAVKGYSEYELMAIIQTEFIRLKCIKEDHVTPLKMKQNFIFCLFKRLIIQ